MPIMTSDAIIGKKEDVSDIIYRISPEDAPFISSIGKRKIDNTFFQWLEKEIVAPSKIAVAEGADAVDQAVVQPIMRSNQTQILSKVLKVSRTADRVGKYGRSQELAEGILDTGIELKQALEFSCVGSKQVVKATSPTEFAGFQAQVDAGNIIKTGGASTPLSEANLNAALLKLSQNGAKPSVLMVSLEDAQTVSAFARDSGRFRDFGGSKTLTNVVTVYAGANGTVTVMQNRILAAGDSLVYNPDNWKLAVLDGWQKEPLAKVGDSKRMQIVGEYSLMHTNYKASAIIRRAV